MNIDAAELDDLNSCYHLNASYTTDYVWQMQVRTQEQSAEIRFDTVRLPRAMQVPYPRATDELTAHWKAEGCFLVARHAGGEVVGFIDAHPLPWQQLLWVYNLVVDAPYRRRGIGSRLLQAAMRWATTRRLRQITVEMQTKNYPAIAMAHKHAFQFCGYNEQYYANGDIALFFSRAV